MAEFYGYSYYSSGPIVPFTAGAGILDQLSVTNVFYNALGLVQIDLNFPVVIDANFLNTDNYVLELIDPAQGIIVIDEVKLTDLNTFTNKIQLKPRTVIRGGLYRVTVNGPLRGINNTEVERPITFEFYATGSKWESLKDKLPPAANTSLEQGDVIGHIIGALAISDNDIGGGEAVIL